MVKIINPKVFDLEIKKLDLKEEKITGIFNNEIITNITLREAVNSLKQPYRTVVVLYYYENLSVLKISQITGATSVAVKKQLSRARKMLREILKEDFGE